MHAPELSQSKKINVLHQSYEASQWGNQLLRLHALNRYAYQLAEPGTYRLIEYIPYLRQISMNKNFA